MITLDSSCTLEIVLGSVPVDAVVVVVDYADQGSTYVRGQQRTKVSVGTAVTICDAPAAGTSRAINRISAYSPNAADTTTDLMVNDGSDTFVVGHAVLSQNEKLRITHDDEQGVNTADGSRKSGAVQDLSAYLTQSAAAALYQTLGGFGESEVPGGLVNGVNDTFSLDETPSPALSLQLFRNGLLQSHGGVDFTLVGNVITYVTAPSIGDTHVCWYRYV